ncbi:hypothetical protein [Roseococcus sp. SYP-B2431]|nr:hypothetical protein [Roseococcus sp. SYP-B2431]
MIPVTAAVEPRLLTSAVLAVALFAALPLWFLSIHQNSARR